MTVSNSTYSELTYGDCLETFTDYTKTYQMGNNTTGRWEYDPHPYPQATSWADYEFVIRLHDTAILTINGISYLPEEKLYTDTSSLSHSSIYTLNTGGYHTATTKDRLNRYTPRDITVYQKEGEWYVQVGTRKFGYRDEMQVKVSMNPMVCPLVTYINNVAFGC